MASSAGAAASSSAGDNQIGNRRLRRQNTEQKVTKMLYDNFKGWGPEEIDLRQRGNPSMSLRERLCHGVRLSKAKDSRAPTFGRKFYDDLKHEYRAQSDPLTMLEPDDDEIVAPALLKAMVAAKSKVKKDNTPMVAWLARGEEVNASEFYGIMSWAYALNPANGNHLPYLLDVLAWLHAGNFAEKWPEKMQILSAWMDDVLVASYTDAKQMKVTAEKFAELHRDIIGLVLPMTEVRGIQAAKEKNQLESVADDLGKVTDSSALGLALFGADLVKVADVLLGKAMRPHLEAFKKGDITRSNLRSTEKTVTEQLHAMAVSKTLDPVRNVQVQYGNLSLEVKVKSSEEHVRLALAAVWKKIAVEHGQIPEMVGESVLKLEKVMGGKQISDTQLVVAARLARSTFQTYVNEEGADSAALLKDVARIKSANMTALDRDWKIEESLLREVTGERAGNRVKAGLVAMMPTQDKAVTPEELMQLITKFQSTDVVKFSPAEFQSKVTAFLAMVVKIVDNRPPAIEEVLTDKFLGEACQLMGNLQRVQVKQDSNTKTLVGTSALQHMYQVAKDKKDNDTLVVEDTVPFEVYSWLLDNSMRSDAKDLIKHVYSKAAKAVKKGKKRQATEDDAAEEAMAMFKSKKKKP